MDSSEKHHRRESTYSNVSVAYECNSPTQTDDDQGAYRDLEGGARQLFNDGVRRMSLLSTPSPRVIWICGIGFRPTTFWLSLVLILICLLAAVGGTVENPLGEGSANLASAWAHRVTQTIEVATVTATQTIEAATVTATTTAAAPPVESSTTPKHGMAQNYCEEGSLYTTPSGLHFKEYCGIDWAGGIHDGIIDIEAKLLGSFEACMIACVEHNEQENVKQKCGAVAFLSDITYAIEVLGEEGNCWLKNQPGTYDTLPEDFRFPEMHSVAQLLD